MLFDKVLGQAVEGKKWTQWGLGAVGMAEWTGVSLRTILALAKLTPNAVSVNAQGLDQEAPEGGTQRPMPIEKALDEDTILAYAMNGEPLPIDHGFPLRLIVPGWVGANSIKWVGTISCFIGQNLDRAKHRNICLTWPRMAASPLCASKR